MSIFPAGDDIRFMFFLYMALYFSRKCSASSKISLLRSRNAGI